MNPSHPIRTGLFRRWAALGLVAALAGCDIVPPAQEDTTRYFVLADASAPALPAPAPAAGGLRIGLKAVRLEGYLKNRPMVVRTGANEVRFEDYHRWAEPLDVAIGRMLRSRLVASPEVSQVLSEPFPFDQTRDFDVSVEITRFEGATLAPGRHAASLAAVVEISTPGPNSRVISRVFFQGADDPWDGTDFERLAALLTKNIGGLSDEILKDLAGAKQ